MQRGSAARQRWLLLSTEPDEAGTPVLGAILHVSVPLFLGAIPVASDAVGFGAERLPLDSRWRGMKVFAQFLWVDPPTCTGIGPLSSSNALAIAVQ